MSSVTTRTHFVVANRLVLTYEPDGWPAAIVTAYADGGGVVVEHVVVFRADALRGLLAIGLKEAWRRGYQYVSFSIPHAFPRARKLERLVMRLGFSVYAGTETYDFYVRYRPA